MQRHKNVTSYPTSIALATVVNLVTAIGCVHIAESVGSRRELVANSCIQTADATRQNSFVASSVCTEFATSSWSTADGFGRQFGN